MTSFFAYNVNTPLIWFPKAESLETTPRRGAGLSKAVTFTRSFCDEKKKSSAENKTQKMQGPLVPSDVG
jgi:hypothetical protein